MQIVKLKKFLREHLPEPLYNLIRDLSLSIKYKSENLKSQSIFEFCTTSNNSSIHYFKQDRQTLISKPIYFSNNTAEYETIHMPPLYWTVLDNIAIIGESNFIISEKPLIVSFLSSRTCLNVVLNMFCFLITFSLLLRHFITYLH